MKRILAFLLSALLLATLVTPLCANAAGTLKLELKADKTQLERGDTVTVTVKATENPGFLLFMAAAQYDRAVFTQEGEVSYGAIGSGTRGRNAVIDAGGDNTAEVGVLYSFTLRVNDDAKDGTYTIGLKAPLGDKPEAVNTSEEDVPCSFNTVTVEVLAPKAEEPAETTPGQGNEEPKETGSEAPADTADALGETAENATGPGDIAPADDGGQTFSAVFVIVCSAVILAVAAAVIVVLVLLRKKSSGKS